MTLRRSTPKFPFTVGHWGGEEGKREQKWLGESWHAIKQAFPIDPADDLGKVKLSLRSIALALIYLDFCELAWGLGSEPEFECDQWAKRLNIDVDSIIRLANISPDDMKESPELFSESLLALADARRKEVVTLLCPDQYDFADFLKGLVAIKDQDEDAYLLDEYMGAAEWCSEKCYPVLYKISNWRS